MKILLVQNTDYIKRNPAQQHHLLELMALRGHEIRVIDFDLLWAEDEKKELKSKRKVFKNFSKIHQDAKITVIRPSIIKLPLLDYVSLFYSQKKEIERQINEFSPDVIYSMGIVAYLAGNAANKHKIPFLYYWIDVTHRLVPYKFLQPLGWLIEKVTLKKADKVLTINQKLKEYVIKLGSEPEKTEVLSAGIYVSKFDPSLNGDEIRKEFGFKKQDIILFFMGWLYEFSGLLEVSKELYNVKNRFPNLKLFIVGDGDIFHNLKEIQEEYGLKESLILSGKMPYERIPELISTANVCILPAHINEAIMQDIVPIKLYEYMAMGKPVITTKLPGVMKEFGNCNGVVYVDKPEDVIETSVELDTEINGKKARKFVVENNNWNKIADKFENKLLMLID